MWWSLVNMMKLQKTVVNLLFVWGVVLQCATAFTWPQWGRCPDFPVQQNLSLHDYQGYWYEQAGIDTKSVEGDKRCVYAHYYLDGDDVFNVQNHGIDNRKNQWGGVNGTAAFTDPANNEAKLTVTFKFGWWKVSGPYWVLDTDYTTYSVVYSCENFLFFFHHYTVWLLSREQTFSSYSELQDFYINADKVLTDHALASSLIQPSDQTNCTV